MSVKEMDAVQEQSLKSNRCKSTDFKNSFYKDGVFEVLQSLRKNENFCDNKLETDDGKIVFGHKLIFISASPYFHAMFTSFEETIKDNVNMRELDYKVLQLLVDYMYTGEITVTEENVQVVLPAADLLQLDYVKQACVLFLQKQLDPSNCLGIKVYADIYNCKELLSSSEEFIKKQFIEVVKYDEFLSLSLEEVIKLVSCDDTCIPFEEKAFECVIDWVKHELNCRKDFLADLMEHVRLPLISKEYLLEKVIDEPLLKSCPKCKDYVFEALHLNLIKSIHPSSVPQTKRNKHRLSCSQKVVLVLSLSRLPNTLISNRYDPATNVMHIAPELSKVYGTGSPGVLNDKFVFAMGGVHYSQFNSVEMLDVSSQAQCWVPENKLLVDRKSFGVGVLHNCIYAVGGDDGSSYLDSVECYDPSINKWNPVAKMSCCRFNVSVGVLDGKMYAIGGIYESYVQKTVEVYNPSTGVWESIPDMYLARQNAGVFTLNGFLYVMGGSLININSIEMYSPKTNSWSMKTISSLEGPILSAVVVHKPLYIRPN
ncbi:kelch-like protein 2 isoform X2 [Myzus persicae]|uniref:kelch-like protein 2 isoform X2 n=1 Tax=Myzus persicae TaxID=13164 RepID=UPI000B9357ED|nr:kelch-like protein 2 isoform X2 [Myzus persicae]